MLIGYARVSTDEQKLDLQLDALNAAGCAHVYSDTLSGARDDRPGLAGALAALGLGDTLVVWKLDRMGRSMRHLLQTIRDLEVRSVEFRSLQEHLDTTTPGGRLVFHVFAAMAEFERDLIRERTRAGLEAARKRGRRGGRRHKLDAAAIKALVSMAKQKIPVEQICTLLKISRATYFRYLKLAEAASSSALPALLGTLAVSANLWC
jgi:DNA invertase Pin-like site-specific DNA recombinase